MKNTFAVISSLCAMAVLIFASPQVIDSCRYALSLCAEMIVPSLFPFFLLSVMLSKTGFPALLGKLLSPLASKLFRVSGAGASAFFIGITGGYPLGAAYIAQLRQDGAISLSEAERLLSFCNNSGPAFIIGAVGVGVFDSPKAGLLLYSCHIAAALLWGILLSFRGEVCPSELPAAKPMGFSQALPEAVSQAVVSVLNVCGFVVCFTVFAGLLDSLGILPALSGRLSEFTGAELHFSRALLVGILEIGSAAGDMRALSASPANLALASGILAWGGISVHFQTFALISDTEIKGTLHFAGRLMCAIFAFVLAFLFSNLLRM